MFSRLEYLAFWQKCQLTEARRPVIKSVCDKVLAFKKDFYDEVEAGTGVPWWVIGAIDYREENFNHTGYLGNGDPLKKKTTHVPRGRGPFATWYQGAIDAIHFSGWDRLPSGGHWDIVTCLIKTEYYNGLGYAHMGKRSPYVWGSTNMQQRGKYVADGHYDPNAWDIQLGTAAIFMGLKEFHGISLNEE